VIFIVVKFPVRAEVAEQWPSIIAEFTQATRAEAGNLFFDWSRSLDDPNEYVVVEAFRDDEAGAAHVQSEHFKTAMAAFPDSISARPKIINVNVPGEEWSEMGELAPR
jgi:quinol monooxygenase YgiN